MTERPGGSKTDTQTERQRDEAAEGEKLTETEKEEPRDNRSMFQNSWRHPDTPEGK